MIPCPEQLFFDLIQLNETQSTNNYLKELCEKGDVKEYTVITTEFQTAGKGQRGNFWESEKGRNLTFSLLIRPSYIHAKEQFIISQIISLSIKEELDQYTNGISIKWPNDIYWNEKKICGILIENSLINNKISESIIGVGLNINQQLFKSSAPNPISLTQITGNQYECSVILANILRHFDFYYKSIRDRNFSFITDKYHDSLFRKQGFHLFSDKDGHFSAEIKGVKPDGFLILTDREGKERSYAFKEVSFILD